MKHTAPRKKTKENCHSLQKLVITYTCNPTDSVGTIWTVIMYIGYWCQDKTLGTLTTGACFIFQYMAVKLRWHTSAYRIKPQFQTVWI